MIRKVLFTCMVLVMLVGGVGAQEMTDLTLFLTYIPNVQFSPFYVAIEKGNFADEGLNITLQYGDEPDGVNLVAADELKFGVFSGEQVIQARANERPVVAVYEWFQKFPVGIVVPAESDIETVNDLSGRRVGIPGRFGASYSGLVALLADAGMSEDDIQLEPIGFNAPEVVCIGGVEAAVVYVNNEPLQIRQRAQVGDCGDIQDVRVIDVASAVDMVSNVIVTNETTIADNPALVESVVRAFDHAVRDSINNPAEAMLISAIYVENLLSDGEMAVFEVEAAAQAEFLADEPEREAIAESRTELRERLTDQLEPGTLVQFDVLLSTIDLWDAEQPGVSEAESWQTTQAVLLSMGFLEAETDLDGTFTNEFLPEAGES